MLTDQAKKTTLLHAHTHARLSRQEGYEDAPQQHRPAPAEILLLFFRSAPTTSLETADFVAQMEKDPKKKIDSLLNPLPATPRTGTEWAGGWPSSPCAASALAQRAVDGSNVLSMPCIVLTSPRLLMGGGRLPTCHLKSHLKLEEMSGRQRERERE